MTYSPGAGGGAGGNDVAVEDEGINLTAAVEKFNFVGSGVTATEPVANEVTVTIGGGGSTAWGDITGTLSSQTDLNTQLNTKVDTSGTPALNDFARFTDADTIEGRSYAETRADLSLEVGTDVQAYSSILANTTASFTTADETKLDGIEAGADVTDTTNVTAAGALMDSEVDADIKTLSLPANTTISAFGASLIDDADKTAARETLGAQIQENGFVDRDDSTITFTDGTRTFQIAPAVTSFDYYQNSIKYTVSSADSVVIADTEGLHYIYYDGSTLSETTTFSLDLITTYALVSVVYWDATNNEGIYVGDERHGATMDSATHSYNHRTFGARFDSGLGVGDITTGQNGNLDTHAQLSVADGVIWDEDIRTAITGGSPQTLSTIAQIPLYYRSGASGDWRKLAATNFPVTTTGTGRAAWNEDTGATWQLTEVTNNDYVLTHLYACPDINNPIIGIVGQSEYSSTAAAEAGADSELLGLQNDQIGSLTPEFVPIATIIFQTSNTKGNTVKSSTEPTADGGDYVDWRFVRGGVSASASTSAVWGDIQGTLSNQTDLQTELDAKLDSSGVSVYGATLIDDADAATARTTLGVDAAGTDNSTDVTLAGTGTYLSLAGQQITVDPITESDISDLQSYLTGNETITLSGDITGSGTTAIATTIANDAVDIAMLSATGTPSSSTFLRGDNTWATPAGGGGGATITFFQVQDDGTTGQLTTGSAVDLAGMWDTPSQTDSDFSWNGTTGVLTVNTAGTVEFNIKVVSYNNANNRHELHIQLYKNGSTVLVEDSQYASRNNTQDEGGAYIPGFLDTASVNDTYRIRIFDIGVAATVGASNVAGMTYISAKLYT